MAALKGALGHEGDLDYANFSYSTTDINAALSITSTVLQRVGEAAVYTGSTYIGVMVLRCWPWSRAPPDGWCVFGTRLHKRVCGVLLLHTTANANAVFGSGKAWH